MVRSRCQEFVWSGVVVRSLYGQESLSGVCMVRSRCQESVWSGVVVRSLYGQESLSGVCMVRSRCQEFVWSGVVVRSLYGHYGPNYRIGQHFSTSVYIYRYVSILHYTVQICKHTSLYSTDM